MALASMQRKTNVSSTDCKHIVVYNIYTCLVDALVQLHFTKQTVF